jgi:hypothetical protein
MDKFKHVRFYLLTNVQSMTTTKKFCAELHLEKYPNIEAIGWDYDFFYLTDYGVMLIPDIALYDKNKKLITLIEGKLDLKELYELTKQ